MVLIFFSTNIIFNYIQEKKDFTTEIWGHRLGSNYLKLEDNSPLAMKFLQKSDWDGIELDCFFDKKINKIIISHNRNYQKFKSEYFFLESIKIPKEISIWLDFKNLGELSLKEISLVKKELNLLNKENRLFIESQNILKLIMHRNNHTNIIFNLPILSENIIYLFFLKFILIFLNIENVSISFQQINLIEKILPQNLLLVYTLSNSDDICKIIKEKKAKIILSKIPKGKITCIR